MRFPPPALWHRRCFEADLLAVPVSDRHRLHASLADRVVLDAEPLAWHGDIILWVALGNTRGGTLGGPVLFRGLLLVARSGYTRGGLCGTVLWIYLELLHLNDGLDTWIRSPQHNVRPR